MPAPDIQEATAERYLELIKAIRGQIQDFVSDYKRDDEAEDWDSVAACTNAIMQLDMSAHGAIEWIEVNAGMRPDPREEEFRMPWEKPQVMPVDVPEGETEGHGSYL